MDDNNLIIAVLVKHALRQRLSREEKALLAEWRARSDNHRILMERFRDNHWVAEQRRQLHAAPTAEMWADICKYIGEDSEAPPAPMAPVRRMFPYRRLAGAAVLFFLLAGAAWFFRQEKQQPPVSLAIRIAESPKPPAPAVPPPGFRAIIRQSEYKLLLLDTLQRGVPIPVGGGYSLRRVDSLNYSYDTIPGAVVGSAGLPQQLITGRKGNIILHWPDGSWIGLNRSSSLRYPADISRADRNIELKGEACFHIAASPSRPCNIALGQDLSIQVLGTSFDARSYGEEEAHWVTVVSGAVKVKKGSRSVVLRGHQEVRVDREGLAVGRVANVSAVVSWMRLTRMGKVVDIENADLPSLLRTVASLYRVQILNPGNIKGIRITGTLSPRQTLQATLRSLELVQLHAVRLQLHGDTVLVMPGQTKEQEN